MGNGLDVHSRFLCSSLFMCEYLCVRGGEFVMNVCKVWCEDALLFVSSELFSSGQNWELCFVRLPDDLIASKCVSADSLAGLCGFCSVENNENGNKRCLIQPLHKKKKVKNLTRV